MDADDLTAAVQAKAATLQAQLLARVEANLSGDVLQTRSGALKASITASLSADPSSIFATVASSGVPYAAI
jgi:hypothetical protein